MNTNGREQRYRERMRRRKEVVGASIDRADREQGLLPALTGNGNGNGNGKSSSAFGMVARARGRGMQFGVAQLIEGRGDTGEEPFFRRRAGLRWHVPGEGFTWDTPNLERDRETAWRGWLHSAITLAGLDARPVKRHLVISERGVPQDPCGAADRVTEPRDVKHAYRAGMRAQKGIDL